jgi:hypothetical protein
MYMVTSQTTLDYDNEKDVLNFSEIFCKWCVTNMLKYVNLTSTLFTVASVYVNKYSSASFQFSSLNVL